MSRLLPDERERGTGAIRDETVIHDEAELRSLLGEPTDLVRAKVRDRLDHYAETTGNMALKPAPLLERLADQDASFASLAAGKGKAA